MAVAVAEPVRCASTAAAMRLATKLPTIRGRGTKYFLRPAGKSEEEGPLTDSAIVARIERLELREGTVREIKPGAVHQPLGSVRELAQALDKANYLNVPDGGQHVCELALSVVAAEQANHVDGPGIRFAIGLIIIRRSPNGDAAIVKSLQQMVDQADASRDAAKINLVKPLKQIIYRLEARAR